jgi:Spondin_N
VFSKRDTLIFYQGIKTMMNSKKWLPALTLTTLAAAAPLHAADISVKIENLTRGIYFTPFLVAAHDDSMRLFSSGSVASTSLQAMAEGGNITPLVADLTANNATMVENPAGGLLGPGQSTTADINTDAAPDNTQLSLVSMLLPTNDAFAGLNAVTIPTEPGVYRYNVSAYDAGTEANDEIRGSGAPGAAGFPVPPGSPVDTGSGNGGTGITASVEGFVHIHRNVIGDTDAGAGVSDISATVHRWLNPVVRVTVTVN